MAGQKAMGWCLGMSLLSLSGLATAPPASGPGAERLQDVDLKIAGKAGERIQTVRVTADASIDQLLRRGGVVPDGAALTITYLLNPGIQSLGSLPAGSQLFLPVYPGSLSPSGSDLPPQHLLVESRTKAELREVQQSLETLIPRVSSFPAERFAAPEEQARMMALLGSIREYLADLNQTARANQLPLHPSLLRESLAEARGIESELQSALRAPGPWPASLQEKIAEVTDDFAIRALSFDEVRQGEEVPKRWRGALVVVHIFRQGRHPVDSLRVYYAPRALVDRPQFTFPFGQVAAEVSQWLGEGNYLIWAGRAGDPSPVTKRLFVPVRLAQDGKPIAVDLVVEP
jgi:hypothetical protein